VCSSDLGGGGGAGCTIWLQTPALVGTGTLAANGGGGGGGGGSGGAAAPGLPGQNCKPNANSAALGGDRGGGGASSAMAGGNGAIEGIAAPVVPSLLGGNGGGGGGGLGRIVYRAPGLDELQSSPAAAPAP
jgi:hypothetical protein